MNQPENSVIENQHYNEKIIRTAMLLDKERKNTQKKQSQTEVPREKLFRRSNRSGLGLTLEYERMGMRPVTPGLQERAEKIGAKFEHLGLTLGTIIHGIDLKQLQNDETISFIRQVLQERKVIFFREQNLSEDEQVAFGKKFGTLDAFPFGRPGKNPYILEIQHNEKSPGMENSWHTDVTWMEKPSLGSVAQCITVPPYGGDTLFSDSHACYLGLPLPLQTKIEHLHGINDYRIFLMGRAGAELSEQVMESIKKDIPFGVSHPLLRTHPETGKTGLFIHGGFLRHDSLYDIRNNQPLEATESQGIVGELLNQHSRPEYGCRFQWTKGSIAFWDNRAVQHYAACDYFPHQRLLRRVTVSGDKPFYAPNR